jgi:hypothetical protein
MLSANPCSLFQRGIGMTSKGSVVLGSETTPCDTAIDDSIASLGAVNVSAELTLLRQGQS